MYEALERRSKERAIAAALAELTSNKTVTDESFASEKATNQMAEAIRRQVKRDNLTAQVQPDGASWRAVFSHLQNGTTPPTVVDLALFHAGEIREIRRLGPELDAIKAPFKLKIGEGESSVDSLKAMGEAVLAAGQKGIEIQRYKGLGEMNAEQLWDTTMDPEARSLLRVQIGSLEAAEEMFTKLMGDQVEPRRAFIEENALNVRNLDI
jgi:DNA gyrase subunit B